MFSLICLNGTPSSWLMYRKMLPTSFPVYLRSIYHFGILPVLIRSWLCLAPASLSLNQKGILRQVGDECKNSWLPKAIRISDYWILSPKWNVYIISSKLRQCGRRWVKNVIARYWLRGKGYLLGITWLAGTVLNSRKLWSSVLDLHKSGPINIQSKMGGEILSSVM